MQQQEEPSLLSARLLLTLVLTLMLILILTLISKPKLDILLAHQRGVLVVAA